MASVSAYETDVALPVTNATKEVYRLAMREGHATEDFSAIYDFLTRSHQTQGFGMITPRRKNLVRERPTSKEGG